MTIDELHSIRERNKKELYKRDTVGKTIQISVAMGEKGIQSGAKDTYKTFARLVDDKDLTAKVMLRQVGSLGHEGNEPVVEVSIDGKRTIYGKVKAEDVESIVSGHIEGGTPFGPRVIGE